MEDGDGGESAPRGSVGNEIFDQVEKLMADEGLSRTHAFQRLSEKTGRRAGTVAANYYRVARQRGAPLQPRAPRGSRSGGGPAAAAAATVGRTPRGGRAPLGRRPTQAKERRHRSIQELAGLRAEVNNVRSTSSAAAGLDQGAARPLA